MKFKMKRKSPENDTKYFLIRNYIRILQDTNITDSNFITVYELNEHNKKIHEFTEENGYYFCQNVGCLIFEYIFVKTIEDSIVFTIKDINNFKYYHNLCDPGKDDLYIRYRKGNVNFEKLKDLWNNGIYDEPDVAKLDISGYKNLELIPLLSDKQVKK